MRFVKRLLHKIFNTFSPQYRQIMNCHSIVHLLSMQSAKQFNVLTELQDKSRTEHIKRGELDCLSSELKRELIQLKAVVSNLTLKLDDKASSNDFKALCDELTGFHARIDRRLDEVNERLIDKAPDLIELASTISDRVEKHIDHRQVRVVGMCNDLSKEVKGALDNCLRRVSSTEYQFIQKRILISIEQAFDYINSNMNSAVFVGGDRLKIKKMALESVSVKGDFLEFGVYKGKSINFLSSLLPEQTFHGFDSFEGLPDNWSSGHSSCEFYGKGSFASDIPKVNSNVMLHKGWFDEVLPVWGEKNREPVAFLHIDCDLYKSTKLVLNALRDKIVPGTVILFDEYFGYFEWREGEYKAFHEFVEEIHVEYEYVYYTYEQVVVVIKNI